MANNLYTLAYRKTLRNGETVFIDGPFDKWGYVIKKVSGDPVDEDRAYFLIRGTGSTERH